MSIIKISVLLLSSLSHPPYLILPISSSLSQPPSLIIPQNPSFSHRPSLALRLSSSLSRPPSLIFPPLTLLSSSHLSLSSSLSPPTPSLSLSTPPSLPLLVLQVTQVTQVRRLNERLHFRTTSLATFKDKTGSSAAPLYSSH